MALLSLSSWETEAYTSLHSRTSDRTSRAGAMERGRRVVQSRVVCRVSVKSRAHLTMRVGASAREAQREHATLAVAVARTPTDALSYLLSCHPIPRHNVIIYRLKIKMETSLSLSISMVNFPKKLCVTQGSLKRAHETGRSLGDALGDHSCSRSGATSDCSLAPLLRSLHSNCS